MTLRWMRSITNTSTLDTYSQQNIAAWCTGSSVYGIGEGSCSAIHNIYICLSSLAEVEISFSREKATSQSPVADHG